MRCIPIGSRGPHTGGQRIVGALGLVAVALGIACGPPPDILLVTFDTLRADRVGAYGGDGKLTASLDELAETGRVFDAAYTTMPTTAPAHASLFTGLRPAEHGVRRNEGRLTEALAARALPARLREAGYATGAFVTSQVMGDPPLGLAGLDRSDVSIQELRPGKSAVAAALQWLDAQPEQPVFLWVHLFDPHSPYGHARRKERAYPVKPGHYGWVDRERYERDYRRRRMAILYTRGVWEADTAFGLLLAGVRELRGAEPFVVAVSDHGELMDERLDDTGFAFGHGSLLSEEVLRIPLILAGPGVGQGRDGAPVSIRDVYPTVLAAAGLRDEEADAKGRRNLLDPPASSVPRVVTAERRRFVGRAELLENLGEGPVAAIEANAVAVTDGAILVVVGADGTRQPAEPPPSHLADAAREALEAFGSGWVGSSAEPVAAEVRERLGRLGYLE